MELRTDIMGHDWYWCGNLPTMSGLWPALSAAAEFASENPVFPTPLHHHTAGLVVAHRRRASAAEESDELDAADRQIRAHQVAIDTEVSRLLAPAPPAAIMHHERIGQVISRMAFLFVNSSTAAGLPLGGPAPAALRVQLMAEEHDYSSLIHDLKYGVRALPPLDRAGENGRGEVDSAAPLVNPGAEPAGVRPPAATDSVQRSRHF